MENLKADKQTLVPVIPEKDLREDIIVGNALDAMMVSNGWKMFEKWISDEYRSGYVMHLFDSEKPEDKIRFEKIMRERMAFERMHTWLKARKDSAERAKKILAELEKNKDNG